MMTKARQGGSTRLLAEIVNEVEVGPCECHECTGKYAKLGSHESWEMYRAILRDRAKADEKRTVRATRIGSSKRK